MQPTYMKVDRAVNRLVVSITKSRGTNYFRLAYQKPKPYKGQRGKNQFLTAKRLKIKLTPAKKFEDPEEAKTTIEKFIRDNNIESYSLLERILELV